MQTTQTKKRRFMLVLPILVLPFLTMAFWAMGGGGGNQSPVDRPAGLNLQLPGANMKADESKDKLSFYDRAALDSAKRQQEIQNDPYYRNGLDTMMAIGDNKPGSLLTDYTNKLNSSPYQASGNMPSKESQIYSRLDALNKAINQPEESNNATAIYSGARADHQPGISRDVDRLENMMQLMNENGNDDPETAQLGAMLDKILDIQHPDRVKTRIRQQSLQKKSQVFTVSHSGRKAEIEVFGNKKNEKKDTARSGKRNRFYDEGNYTNENAEPNAVEAVIHETQTVVTGSTIKLRIMTDIYVNGVLVTKGSFVWGIASLDGERLQIQIPNIRSGNNLLPVSLAVYDIDGLPGIHIPGSISRDVAKQSADQALQSVEFMSMDPSIKAQAASVGINAAKSLFSKKAKLVKVTCKAGYKVLLKDQNKQDN